MRFSAFLFQVAFIAVVLASAALAAKPNVVLIVTDDQGYGDLSCHGNPVLKTPNLDALYRDSVRFTDYHVAPTCSPTRAALQTGHWTNRTGVWHTIMGRSILRADEVTIGQMFQDAGYATGMFGKWHLGDNYPSRPEDRGYQEVMRHGGGGVGQTPDYWNNAYFDGSYFHNSNPQPAEGFCTDVWFDYARQFITAQKEAGKPFFAYIATNAPHGPMHSPKSFSEPYQARGVQVANFYGMIANIDYNVGKLRTFLAEQGLAKNTIFIFTTDNGTAAGERVFNAGMRGKKGSEFDGGHRVPLFIHWPHEGLTGGRDVDTLAAHIDVTPTLLDLCGIARPEGVEFDGRSLKPLLFDGADDWLDRMLITDSQRVKDPIKWRKSAVMTQRWRLINGQQLYDIKADPAQKSDVAKDNPEVVHRLRVFYDAWWKELAPTFEQDCPIYLGHEDENPATLTSHDWIADRLTPWNQAMIRAGMSDPDVTGYWNVKVVREGEYEIRLRRWPVEAGAGVDAMLPPGDDVPGVTPYRAHVGKAIPVAKARIEIAGRAMEQEVKAGAEEAVFRLKLPKGDSRLTARFITDDGSEVGAYYAYVQRR